MINILILGHKGMLGHMLFKVFNKNIKYNIITSDLRYPNWDKKMFEGIDFVINCIGAIPQKTNNFDINWQIPIWLNEELNCKIIHPASDCEVDNSDYGISKSKATDFIINKAKTTKIIQTSIIGPELNSNASLLEWFLSQRGVVYGYTQAIWNGITTLEWSKQCEKIINNWDNYPTLNVFHSNKVSKFELLNIIKDLKGEYKILSAPLANDPKAEPHKREWIKKNLAFFPPKEVIISADKYKWAKQPDGTPNILIDDFGSNIRNWEAKGGVGFKHKDHKFERTAGLLKDYFNKPVEERELDKDEEAEKERIVKGMKKNKSDFKKRYGKDAEAVMYATATKMAKSG